MKPVITKDNSITFYSEEYGETYHSVTGAVEKAFKKFVEPCHVDGRAELGMISILDICFGLGYNSGAAIDKIIEANPDCKIYIVGLEKDEQILKEIVSLEPQIKNYYIIKEAIKNNNKYENKNSNVKINLLVCDALEAVKKLKLKFDIIFLDPFSPKKNPELWTESLFKELRRLINKDGVLTTYSCAGIVRRNLKAAGFEVQDGPCVGRMSPSTIAFPQ